MRYLHRTHRVSAQWLHERFALFPQNVDIFYEDSCDMCADITKWSHACDLINIVHPTRLRELFKQHDAYLAKPPRDQRTGSGAPASPC
eukprot:12520594-Alexandrium_andersonii.AAC.1